ncbi:MAG: hypothetical protein ACEPO8_12745, partial [Rhodothermaceae bacterium]
YKEPKGDIIANGVILHYDGTGWKNISLPTIQSLLYTLYPSEEKGKYYIQGSSLDKKKTWLPQLYSFNGKEIDLVYEDQIDDFKLGAQRQINGESYFFYDRYISEYSEGKFVKLINTSDSKYTGGFEGRSLKDLFLFAEDGVAHYNGTDFQYLFNVKENHEIINITIAETMIYVVVKNKENQDYYIYKGKLKEEAAP